MRRALLFFACFASPLTACSDDSVAPLGDGGTATGGRQGSTGGSRSSGGEFTADPRCPRDTMAPPGECRPTWAQATAAYPKACVPGPVQPGGCQGQGASWCGYQTITFSYGDSRGLMLCAYEPASGELVGIVNSARGTLTCRTYDPDFPPEEFYEDTCRPGGGGGAGGANTGGAATAGASTGGANTGGTGGASGGTGGILEGGTESGVPDGHAGGSDAGQTDASSEGG